MTLDLKLIIYISAYIVTFISLFLVQRNRLHNIEKNQKRDHQVIYGDRGKLNLVDDATLQKHLDDIYGRIRRNESNAERQIKQLDELNKNVIIIMTIMRVKPPAIEEDAE